MLASEFMHCNLVHPPHAAVMHHTGQGRFPPDTDHMGSEIMNLGWNAYSIERVRRDDDDPCDWNAVLLAICRACLSARDGDNLAPREACLERSRERRPFAATNIVRGYGQSLG